MKASGWSVRSIAASLIGSIIVAGCAGSASPSPAVGTPGGQDAVGLPRVTASKKRITAAIRGEPATLSAIIDSSGVGGTAGVAELEEMINVGLAEIVDNRVATRARLAASLPTVDNGQWKAFPDGRMEITWKIRSDARWHDGTPVTSADLLFTTQVGRDGELTVLSNNAYKFVESVEAPDPSTIKLTWKRPYILADTMFSGSFALPLPKHILEPVFLEAKATFAEHPYWTEQFIGTGPFRVREFVRGSHVVLEAFDGYPLGRPKIDEVEIKFINDPNVIVANVLSGAVDLTLGRGLAPEEASEAERQWGQGKVGTAYGTSWTALYPQFVDPSPAAIANLPFRRALMHAMNRQQLVDTLAQGKTRPVSSYIGPNSPEFPEVQASVMDYPYDQKRAVELVSGLGFSRGPNGMFLDSNGQPLTVEIRTTTGDELRTNAMLAIADMWKAIGVATETVVVPRQRADDREYRVTRPGFELVHQPNELTERALQRFETEEIPTAQNDWRGNNRARYSSPEYDGLVDRYLVTLNARDRLEVARQLMHHFSEQLPAMGILYRVDVMLIANRLTKVSAETSTRNAQEWDLR
jgi:peptide/nickel transport system substrate-binding protein